MVWFLLCLLVFNSPAVWGQQSSDAESLSDVGKEILEGFVGWNFNLMDDEYQTLILGRLNDLDATKLKEDLLLQYKRPAREWVEALPIGAGRLGAMIFGDPINEHLQINEDTIWTGRPHDYAHKGAYKYLDTLRNLINAGRQQEAEGLAMREFMSVPLTQKAYQPFCDLRLEFKGLNSRQIENYQRELDIEQAISSVTFDHQGVSYKENILPVIPTKQSLYVALPIKTA